MSHLYGRIISSPPAFLMHLLTLIHSCYIIYKSSDYSFYFTVCELGVFYGKGMTVNFWQWWDTKPHPLGRAESIATAIAFCLVLRHNQD